MMNLRSGTMLVLLGGMLLSTTPADAQLASSFGCASAKLKSLGKTASSVFGCYSKLAKVGGGLSAIETAAPGCVQKAEDKWDLAPIGAFQKAETKAALVPPGCAVEGQTFVLDGRCSGNPARACLTNFDCAAVAAPPPPLPAEGVCNIHSDATEAQALYDLVNDETIARPTHPTLNGLVQEVLPSLIPTATANGCNSSKVKTTGKLAAALLNCHSKAAKSDLSVDQACIDKAILKHNASYQKAEDKGALKPPQCDVVGNADAVVTQVVAFAEKAVTGIPRRDGCGSGVVIAPETCDDGNTVNTDACPSDCIIDSCTPNSGSDDPWTVTYTSPGGKPVGSLTVFVDFPENKLSLPGTGGGTPPGIFEFDSFSVSAVTNDVEHGFNGNLTSIAVPVQDLGADPLIVHFETCSGAPSAAAAGDFVCTVLGASDLTGKALKGVTCGVHD
jgi:cysteine-rich repeat protein